MTANQVSILLALLALFGSLLSLWESRSARKAIRGFEQSNLLLEDLRKAHEELGERPEVGLAGQEGIIKAFSAKQELCHRVVDQYSHLLPSGDRDEVRTLRRQIEETTAFHQGKKMGLVPDESKFQLIPLEDFVEVSSRYVRTVEGAFNRELDRVTDLARRNVGT